MKRVYICMLLVVSLVFPFFIFAAGQAESESGKSDLRVAWWGNPTRDKRTLAVIDLYQQKYPNVTIEPETVGWPGYWDRINTQVAAGNLPDIMQHDYAYLLQFVARNQMKDLTPYVQDGSINLKGVDEAYLSGGRIDEKLFGISLGTNAVCLVYDPAVLQKAGLEEPGLEWTWADFEKMALKIYAKTGVKTIPFFTTDPKVGFDNWIRQTGKSFFSSDGKTLGFTDQKPLEEFFAIQLRLQDAGALVRADEAFVTMTPQEGHLAKGESWLDFYWSNQFTSTQEAVNRPLEIALLPRITNNFKRPGTYLKPSMFFSIPAISEKPGEAAMFLNFFLNDPEANGILLGERGVPIIQSVREVVKNSVDANMQMVFDYITLVGNGNASPIDPPDPAATGEILKMFRDTTQEVLSGKLNAAEGAEKIMTKANSILAR